MGSYYGKWICPGCGFNHPGYVNACYKCGGNNTTHYAKVLKDKADEAKRFEASSALVTQAQELKIGGKT